MMTTLRGSYAMFSKVSDAMKTLNANPDSTSYLPARAAGRRLLAGVVLLAASVLGGALAMAQTATPTPQPVMVADFNHDGIPDALVLSTTTPTAVIAFGSVPYGTFGGGSMAVTFPEGCASPLAGSLVVGDFNGDGFPDIAFFCAGISGTMLGNGDGTFAAASVFSDPVAGTAVVGDFNKDGKLDIAILVTTGLSAASQAIQFLAGNGDGTFQEAVISNLTTSSSYHAMVAADLNADGYPDLILLNSPTDGTASVDVYGNNQGGTFGSGGQGVFAANTSGTIATGGATTLLTGNVFGAATTDIVVPVPGANGKLYVYQNASSGTTFSLNDPVTVPVANLTGAQAGRFTGSGFTDVAVANGTNISVLANDGTGNLTTNYATLALASTSPVFAVADANGDGYSDIYTATLPQSGAMQLGVALTTGTATATSQPVSLAIGTQAIGAAWVGNVNFTGSAATGSEIVVGLGSVTALASSKDPSVVGDSVTLSVHVAAGANVQTDATPTGTIVLMDGSTMLASGGLDDGGNYTFTTTALTQGTHAIAANYSGDTLFGKSTAMLSQVVAGVTVTSFTPTTASLGAGATTLMVTGTGFDASSVVQVNGTAIMTTLVNATTLQAVIPATYFTTVGTLGITVFDPAPVNVTSGTVSFTVTAPAPLPIVTVSSPTASPGTQPTVTLSLTQAYPVDIMATVTLSFAASTTPAVDDPSIVFAATGNRMEDVTIPAGSLTAPPIELQAGTVAGTITVPVTLTAGGQNVTPANLAPAVIVVPAAVPTITSATVTRSGTQLTVVMHGFSNTREMVNAKFHFTPAAGASLTTTDLTITADTIFNTNWFETTGSDQYGSTFTYTQIFNTSDDATTVGSVEVTLTNTVGASEMVTTQ